MTLLTPNFAEKVNKTSPEISPQGDAGSMPHIVAQHEPLSNEPVNPIALPSFDSLPPIQLFSNKEQTVNVPVNIAPAAEPAPLKIALIGTAPSSRMLAPYNDPSWKIWGCSPGNQNILPRVDAWFELHKNLLWPEYKHYGEPYIAWLKQQKFPIYMQDQSLVPNALIFPKDEMVKEFGPHFFTSSFAWMMALAITQGAKEIALYGIDMASREEYIIQRPGAYYFMIEGAKRGCKIWAPYESDIMQPPGLYAYSDVNPLGRKLLARKAELQQRIAGMRQQQASLAHDLPYLEGANEDVDYMISIQIGAQDNASTGYLDQLLQKAKDSTTSQG